MKLPKDDNIRSSPFPLSIDRRMVFVQRVANDVKHIEKDETLLDKWTELWSEVKHEIDTILRKDSQSIDTFAKRFPQIELTVDPRIFAHFAPTRDIFAVNIYGAFFYPPYELAGTLIHEDDHKWFYEEHQMLGLTDQQYKEFHKRYGVEIELRALGKELGFIKRIKPFISSEWYVEFLPQNLNLPYPRFSYKVEDYIRLKEQLVKQLSECKEMAKNYDHRRQDASFAGLTKIMEVLGILVDRAFLGKTYERISVPF